MIVPAILEETKEGFLDKVSRVTKLSGLERVQVDFCDGEFVPNRTVSVHDIDALNPAFTWEAHLMVREPVDFLDYQIAGFNVIVVHYEAFENTAALEQGIRQIKKLGLKAGLAVNPETPVDALMDFSHAVDQFLVMSVHPGFQSQEFLADSEKRVAALRKLAPRGIIEVDGGVKPSNILQLSAAGANLIAVGSALFETENIQENYDSLVKAMVK